MTSKNGESTANMTGKPLPRITKKRRCAIKECGVVLSTYNKTDTCLHHHVSRTPLGHYTPRVLKQKKDDET